MTARDLPGGTEIIVPRGSGAWMRQVGFEHVREIAAGESIDIDGLFIYQVKGGNIGRVFAVETGREMAGKRVQGLVQFVPARGGKGFEIDLRPGAAKGWTRETYPWPQDKPGAGPVDLRTTRLGDTTTFSTAPPSSGSSMASRAATAVISATGM